MSTVPRSNVDFDLGAIVARKLYEHPRLRGVPLPVIDEVVEAVFDELVNGVPNLDTTLAALVFEEGWALCEACSEWVPPRQGKRTDDECTFCKACAADR